MFVVCCLLFGLPAAVDLFALFVECHFHSFVHQREFPLTPGGVAWDNTGRLSSRTSTDPLTIPALEPPDLFVVANKEQQQKPKNK